MGLKPLPVAMCVLGLLGGIVFVALTERADKGGIIIGISACCGWVIGNIVLLGRSVPSIIREVKVLRERGLCARGRGQRKNMIPRQSRKLGTVRLFLLVIFYHAHKRGEPKTQPREAKYAHREGEEVGRQMEEYEGQKAEGDQRR